MKMFEIVSFLMCITAYVNSAGVPNIEILLPPIQEMRRDVNQDNLASESSVNEVDAVEETNICTTEICARESAIMLSSLDESVNPCEDFYEFACGDYIRNTVLPEDKAVDLSFLKVQENVGEQLRLILTEEPQPDELHPFKLAKDFTKICMDEALLNEQGRKSMIPKKFCLF